jgi:putative peptidoglycan lipid II flippase
MADRFYQLPLGLVGVAIGVALLPRLSQALASKDHDDAQFATDQAVVFALALALPAAVAMTFAPFYLVDGLYTRGRFTLFDSQQTAVILFHYGWGTPAFVLNRILAPVFFARGDTKAPMHFATLSVIVNLVLGIVLLKVIGVGGIAAATSIAAWINVAQMVWILRKRGEYTPTAHTANKLTRILAANGVLAVLVLACTHFRPQIEAVLSGVSFHGFGPKEVSVILLSLLTIAVYPFVLLATGGIRMEEAWTVFRSGGRKPQPQPGPLP